jgi:hypothetical protein
LAAISQHGRSNFNFANGFERTFEPLVQYAAGAFRFIKQHPLAFAVLLTVLALPHPAVWDSSAVQKVRSYGQDIHHALGQTINLKSLYSEDDVADLQKRMLHAEYDINRLKKSSSLDHEAIKHLESRLPDYLLLKKGKNGQIQIPIDFWRALKVKMQSESPILKDYFIQDGQMRPGDGELTEGHVQKIARNAWSNFLDQNQVRIMAWQREVFDDTWDENIKKALANDVLVSKMDFSEELTRQWADSQKSVHVEIGRVLKKIARLENAIPPEQQYTDQGQIHAVGLTKGEVQAISQATFKKMVPSIKLEALAQTKLNQATSESLWRVNHLSLGNGAVTKPQTTTPTLPSPFQQSTFFKRQLLRFLGDGRRTPNPPSEALTKWDEAGDCWCAPSKGTSTGMQLGVLLGNKIYPDQVIIEHIPSSATLDTGAAPREIELIAKIEGWEEAEKAGALSDRLFQDQTPETDLDGSYILLARFTYDPNDPNFRQSFAVPLDLKSLHISTSEVVIRAVSNAGADHTCFYRVRLHGEIA